MTNKSKIFLASLLILSLTNAFAVDKTIIATVDAPKAIGPYSQAVKVGNQLFLSGQIALDPVTNQMTEGDIEVQSRVVLSNLKAVLAANNMTMDHVVMSTVYMANLADFAKFNSIYGEYFKANPPARATVGVASLPRNALVEISFIAAK